MIGDVMIGDVFRAYDCKETTWLLGGRLGYQEVVPTIEKVTTLINADE